MRQRKDQARTPGTRGGGRQIQQVRRDLRQSGAIEHHRARGVEHVSQGEDMRHPLDPAR